MKAYRREGTRWTAGGRRAAPLFITGFTLVELLVAIGIVVLVLAMAVPAFRYMTGSRSTEAGENVIAAMLGRARADAIGLQQACGILFYIDPGTQRVALVQVRATADRPVWSASPEPEVYLDLVADRDAALLAPGVGVQLVDDVTAPTNDRYIGFNSIGGSNRFGGVILFDSHGLLASRTYALRARNMANETTALGAVLNLAGDWVAVNSSSIPKSQFGFVLYEQEVFAGRGFPETDVQIAGGSYSDGSDADEQSEEQWLDENATPVLVNRYNGTLLRGE